MVKKILIILLLITIAFAYIGNMNISLARDVQGTTGSGTSKASDADSIISGASGFVKDGEKNADQNGKDGELVEISNSIYNMILAIAMIVAVTVGIALGIKFITSSVEEQAKVKELLVPYVTGCIVIFGALGIWKLAVTTFSKF